MSFRKKLIVPGEGKKTRVNLQGKSFAIELASVYDSPEDVPYIEKSGIDGEFPCYPRNVYGNDPRNFSDLFLHGTAQSEGDEVHIYVTDDCLDTVFNIVLSEQYSMEPGESDTKQANDSVKQITELDLLNADNELPKIVYISVAPSGVNVDGIKWAINADPVQGDDSLGTQLKAPENGNSGILEFDLKTALALRFIAKTNGQTPLLNYVGQY